MYSSTYSGANPRTKSNLSPPNPISSRSHAIQRFSANRSSELAWSRSGAGP